MPRKKQRQEWEKFVSDEETVISDELEWENEEPSKSHSITGDSEKEEKLGLFIRSIYGLGFLASLFAAFVMMGGALSYGLLHTLANNVVGQAAIFLFNASIGGAGGTLGSVLAATILGVFATAFFVALGSMFFRSMWRGEGLFTPLMALKRQSDTMANSFRSLVDVDVKDKLIKQTEVTSNIVLWSKGKIGKINEIFTTPITRAYEDTRSNSKNLIYLFNPMIWIRALVEFVRNLLLVAVDVPEAVGTGIRNKYISRSDDVDYIIEDSSEESIEISSPYPIRAIKSAVQALFYLIDILLVMLQIAIDLPLHAIQMAGETTVSAGKSIADWVSSLRSRGGRGKGVNISGLERKSRGSENQNYFDSDDNFFDFDSDSGDPFQHRQFDMFQKKSDQKGKPIPASGKIKVNVPASLFYRPSQEYEYDQNTTWGDLIGQLQLSEEDTQHVEHPIGSRKDKSNEYSYGLKFDGFYESKKYLISDDALDNMEFIKPSAKIVDTVKIKTRGNSNDKWQTYSSSSNWPIHLDNLILCDVNYESCQGYRKLLK